MDGFSRILLEEFLSELSPDAQHYLNLVRSNAVSFKFTRKKEGSQIEIGNINNEEKTTYFAKDICIGFDMHYSGKIFGVFSRPIRRAHLGRG
ncbi:MAG: hypothetical protein NTU95_04200 [Methanothrix sp.]|nr:hypothetical protein [Methanothrix sp.]